MLFAGTFASPGGGWIWWEAHVFNLKKMLKERSLGEAAELRPGDLVFVPGKIPFRRSNSRS